ncbi:GntR family transcriptional regulator [Actinocorallia herbida]|uniref:GntR family transcriptional regulator n=1 Tax=Actinocorallia herbida TaxID=58109 RepID=A0A3N1D0G0_9ACTN|nr:GntR family transcriptional regulator [Actinocorallia herbida]ROO87000.1 GntR family transcriptional regulator [Actinocorallia herbida]
MSVLDDLRDQSLSERVYAWLREQILNGRFAPGQRLIERELAELMQVSRVPLREALPLLENDGFVKLLPRRGAVVTQPTLRDIDELFDVRESLEVLAARLAARRAAADPGAPDVLALADCIQRARRALADGDDATAAAANVAFHRQIVKASGHLLLHDLMQPLDGRMEWLFRMTGDRDLTLQCAEHEQLYEALRTGNVDLAGSLAFVHVASGRAPSLRTLLGVLPPS